MQRQMLKSKIHRATVTDCDVDYIGSITIDTDLMAEADLITNEQVHVWDIDNGSRFVTYVIDGEPGSRTMQVNGAAAHLTEPGHKVIVASFGAYDESDLERYSPVVVHVDEDNRSVAVDSHPEVLLSSSSGGRSHTAPPSADRTPVNLPRLAEMKANGEPIVMVTAYDYPSATVAEAAGVDIVLVGDSAAMVVLGHPGTEQVSMEEMIVLGKAVRRGLKTPLMVGDMPMGSYESSNELAVQNAQRLVKETGCQVVKLEAGGIAVERARSIVRSGIPVMGHVGLTPQTATALGGYKAQGKTAKDAIQLCEDALALQSVGCFAIVFEAVPAAVTEAIVAKLEIPSIGIGAGPSTSGQVLVFHDLLGITTGHMAKFVKRYANVHEQMVAAVGQYGDEVRSRHFPEPDHVYSVEPAELDEFRRYLDQESLASQKAWDWEPLP